MNLYEDIAFRPGAEDFLCIFEDDRVKIERITSSNCPSGPYCQDEDEWVMVMEGSAELIVEGKKLALVKGDSLFIPKQTVHSVVSTSPECIWLAIFVK